MTEPEEFTEMMGTAKLVLLIVVVAAFLPTVCSAQLGNEESIGLMVGDPIAISYRQPMSESTFLDVKAGLWTWHLWSEPVAFEVPYVAVDYGWFHERDGFPEAWYIGGGLAWFLGDNPKDNSGADSALAIRLPVGARLYSDGDMAIDLELAPIHQFAPWHVGGPYGVELNGGLVFRYGF